MTGTRALCAAVAVALPGAVAYAAPLGHTAPSECASETTRAALASFVVAFNAGNYPRLDAVVAPRPFFRWFSSGGPGLRMGAAAGNRATLISYVRRRHLVRDRLRLRSFRFTGNTPGNEHVPGYGNFTFVVSRSAADYRGGKWIRVVGKGAAVCSTDRVQLIVMSIGGPQRAG